MSLPSHSPLVISSSSLPTLTLFICRPLPNHLQGNEGHSRKNKQRFKEMLKNQNKKKLRHKHFVSSSAYCIPLGTSRLNVRLGLAGSLLQFVREKTPGEIGRNQGCVRKHPGCLWRRSRRTQLLGWGQEST